jgi:hypothetical protein
MNVKNNHQELVTIHSTPAADGSGTWKHAMSGSFVFYFEQYGWTTNQKQIMAKAFKEALGIPNLIKQAVLDTSGQDVVNGVYTQDKSAMVKAMNSIHGMSQTSSSTSNLSGSGTITDANQQLFNRMLAGIGGDVSPMMTYLNSEMSIYQQTAAGMPTSPQYFGISMAVLSLVEVFDTPVTSALYTFTKADSAATLIEHSCESPTTEFSWNLDYEIVKFLYNTSDHALFA